MLRLLPLSCRHHCQFYWHYHSAALPHRPPPLSLLADQCKSIKQLKQVHAQMIVTARIQDNYAASRILSFTVTSKSPDLHYATNLFHNTTNPNSFMWNTTIRAHADGPNPSNAILLYIDMVRLQPHAPPPGRHTFPFLLKACTNSDAVQVCRQVHTHVFKHGLELDVYVVNGLIRCYGSACLLFEARKLFDEMPERNLVVWTTMVSGYAQNHRSDDALVLFDQMIREGIEPNDATLSSVLSACARSGCLELGEQIHSFIDENGIEVGVILGTALVDMYAKNGVIAKAYKLFNLMPGKNTATWNAMICGLAHHGHTKAALDLFREFEKQVEIMPNNTTFVGVLSACCHAGLVDVGREIFFSMERLYGIQPKIEHYSCMVDLLGRRGRLLEAEELMKGMRWEPDVSVLGALLTACRKHKNVEIAERVAEMMLGLDPSNHGVYVVMSNVYAESGKWEEVARLRKMMRTGGLKKVPGWSCVDAGDDGS